jgi:hypothetical protein
MTICISIFTASDSYASDFPKQGSKWLGCGFSYSKIRLPLEYSLLNMLQVVPVLRFFPVDHFMLGPSLSWTGIFSERMGAINQFGIGADIGGVFNADDKLYPYVRSGGNLAIISGIGE